MHADTALLPKGDEWLTTKQVAHLIGVSLQFLYDHRGTLNAPPHHRRGRRLRYLKSEVAEWAQLQRDK